jgi:hypothetical protein
MSPFTKRSYQNASFRVLLFYQPIVPMGLENSFYRAQILYLAINLYLSIPMSLTKTGIACILLLLLKLGAMAQTIKGWVYRAGTDTVIAGASVYYGGSMAGTITNSKGEFELAAKQQQIPVIVSCIGYYSATVNYTQGQLLKVYLKPKIEVLRTVTIRADGMDRDAEIAIFMREFIGSSPFAKSCTITNMDDINFFYSKKTRTLTASCDKPVVIENKALGYTISYYLDRFSNTNKNVFFAGNYIFKENTASADSIQIKHNRETAYKGSRMQFVRALWQRDLKGYDFSIYNQNYIPLEESNILARDSLGQKYVRWHSPIFISHDKRSTVTPTQDASFIDKDGFYDGGLQWSGAMANQRIGDLLPFEYLSEKEFKTPPVTRSLPAKATTGSKTAVPQPTQKNHF